MVQQSSTLLHGCMPLTRLTHNNGLKLHNILVALLLEPHT